MTKQKRLIFITIGLLSFIILGLVLRADNGQKKTKKITQPIINLIEEKEINKKLKCPPGQKYVDYGRPDIPSRCYTPAPDAGETCTSSTECTKKCIVDENDPMIDECNIKPNQENFCPGISGTCGDGSEIGVISIAQEPGYVIWFFPD